LVDFGLAKDLANVGRKMSFCGSPPYLAPEVITDQKSNKKTDIYGIGLVLYEMLVGRAPFFSENKKHLY